MKFDKYLKKLLNIDTHANGKTDREPNEGIDKKFEEVL